MTLASIQSIVSVEHHNNADLLDVVQVKGYKAIVKRDQWKVGDPCVFIEPDSVLPVVPWSAFYRAKSNRVKAVRLRSVWSFGIVESPIVVGYTGSLEVGLDVTEVLGITKYEPPTPQDLNASGPYGFGIPRTDEHRWQSLDSLPYGEKVDVTLKIDGQSWSAFWLTDTLGNPQWGVGGRSFLYQLDCDNNYTRNERTYGVLAKLAKFWLDHKVGICLRGEQYGHGIQKGSHNPHAQLPLNLALFSTWLIDERKYATKGHPFYAYTIAPLMGLPTAPMLEQDVILTPELIKKYSEDLVEVNGKPFEGVVVNHANGSFKVLSLLYDSRK